MAFFFTEIIFSVRINFSTTWGAVRSLITIPRIGLLLIARSIFYVNSCLGTKLFLRVRQSIELSVVIYCLLPIDLSVNPLDDSRILR